MMEKGMRIAVNIFVRMVLGIAIIFFVNEFLSSQDISVQVGINPITILTSGILGIPGVALLYGIGFYGIL
nr:pro-sigmaK processing inhibitor BofA family protein [uncultured Merdimonas sp.]